MDNVTAEAPHHTSESSGSDVFVSIDRYVTPVWYVLGIPGNLLAYCVWMQRKMRRSSGIYLASLALNEFFFLVMQVIVCLYTPVWVRAGPKIVCFPSQNVQ